MRAKGDAVSEPTYTLTITEQDLDLIVEALEIISPDQNDTGNQASELAIKLRKLQESGTHA
jgi:hypothetical protein